MPKELPLPLKDIEYKIIGRPKLEKQQEEMPEEIKKLRCEYESAHNHLRNAMAFEYDKVYLFSEMKMEEMRKKVRELHDKLVKAGWGITDMK
jgi:hypothetical protein